MLSLLAVFIGGGSGSLCRYGLSFLFPATVYPLATLAANVLACLLLGYLVGIDLQNNTIKLLLATGFCGGFSTFSTFGKEALALGQQQLWSGLGYTLLSILLGMIALYVGIAIGQYSTLDS